MNPPITIRAVPAAQALQFTIQCLSETLVWLETIEKEWEKKYRAKRDGSTFRLRSRILTDAVAMYVATLAEKGGSGHSLLKSYPPNKFVKQFAALPIVKKCQMNRNNRGAHQSRSYGHFVSAKEILESDLKSWISAAELFLATTPELLK